MLIVPSPVSQDLVSQVQGKTSDFQGAVGGHVEAAKDNAGQMAGSAQDQAGQVPEQASHAASEVSGKAKDMAVDKNEQGERMRRESPDVAQQQPGEEGEDFVSPIEKYLEVEEQHNDIMTPAGGPALSSLASTLASTNAADISVLTSP
ncbi:hypothetical protein CEUSTIGMA_g10972.t1 [Chlamydomonas eustigma]|uniref:Uncharacterized protein n=1 Tax=Chlamydomonas eustigma TaxID=1157962 RepID=A0A250XKG8_9CHLO|nr:hypothetical protein CEUSTIGMA_g10972.t1 [Chlamydomonas eustigma]|eukprot:GAX83547.1 hypothetical protein CEUSTIGMA_g10972.t1 [Chlamydomonas eustigma]